MPRGRRSRAQMVVEVLEACTSTPQTQTSLLRSLGLTTATTRGILEFLLQGGLIEPIIETPPGNSGYRTTPRGRDALAKYYELMASYFKGLGP